MQLLLNAMDRPRTTILQRPGCWQGHRVAVASTSLERPVPPQIPGDPGCPSVESMASPGLRPVPCCLKVSALTSLAGDEPAVVAKTLREGLIRIGTNIRKQGPSPQQPMLLHRVISTSSPKSVTRQLIPRLQTNCKNARRDAMGHLRTCKRRLSLSFRMYK